MYRIAPALALTLLPAVGAAHPHIFVEARLEIVFDGDQLRGVRMSWTYDDFFSFLLIEELGLDPDGDGALTAAELETLAGVVLDWPADFEGDLEVWQGGQVLELGPREQAGLDVSEARVSEVHFRPVSGDVSAGEPIRVQVYDPFYYTAYDVYGPIEITGRSDCEATIDRADITAANDMVEEMLYGKTAAEVGPDEYFPPVGDAFADTITVTCGG